jgi:uncharacterized membrane protein YfhO
VTSIAAWRGWRALSDGRELPLAFANHAFVAIEVPPGRHRVRVFYLPESFVWGRRISCAALAGLAVWALARPLRRRASA